jgi:hypothetical protein
MKALNHIFVALDCRTYPRRLGASQAAAQCRAKRLQDDTAMEEVVLSVLASGANNTGAGARTPPV